MGLGGCVGLVLAAWGALMAACPCSRGSETPAGIRPEPAWRPRGGSRAATSPLCPQMGGRWGQGPRFPRGAMMGIAPWGGKGQLGVPSAALGTLLPGLARFFFGTLQSSLFIGSEHPWGPCVPILGGSEERGAAGAIAAVECQGPHYP